MANKHEGAALALALGGSLAAVAAIAITYGFVTPPNLLVLTTGEWELLAIVLYLFAIVVFVFGAQGSRRNERAVGVVGFAPIRATRGSLRGRIRAEDHDALYSETLEVAEA